MDTYNGQVLLCLPAMAALQLLLWLSTDTLTAGSSLQMQTDVCVEARYVLDAVAVPLSAPLVYP